VLNLENPAHLLDAARYVKEAWGKILPISTENCFRKADISIEFQDERGQSQTFLFIFYSQFGCLFVNAFSLQEES
jgi:hypothetical protein